MKTRILLIAMAFAVLFAMQAVVVSAEPIDDVKANIKKHADAVMMEVPAISVQELKEMMDEKKVFFEIVDVREKDEYDAGHLADAILAPRGKVEWVLPGKIKDPATKIFVYCKGGARGALATKALIDAGYSNAINITGGFASWAKEGYPFYNLHGECVVTKGGFGKKPE